MAVAAGMCRAHAWLIWSDYACGGCCVVLTCSYSYACTYESQCDLEGYFEISMPLPFGFGFHEQDFFIVCSTSPLALRRRVVLFTIIALITLCSLCGGCSWSLAAKGETSKTSRDICGHGMDDRYGHRSCQ